MSVNKAILIGHVGKDPDIRKAPSGKPVASFSVATTKRWTDRDSREKKEHTEWHRVVVFSEGLTKVVADYVKKGSKLYVEGEMRTRKWTDRAGVERFTTEVVLAEFSGSIVLLDRKESAPAATSESDYGGAAPEAPIEEIPY